MEFKGLKILVMDGAGKQTHAMIKGLKELGCFVTVIATSKLDACYHSKYVDRKILLKPEEMSGENLISTLLRLVSGKEYDVLMPVGELSTNPVTSHEAELSKYVKIACAPRKTYIKAFNKQTTFDTAIENGIPCPYTRHSKQTIEDFLDHAHFPIIIKPRQGLGSIGFHKFNTEDEFLKRLEDPSFNVDDYVVQEFVHFDNRIGTNIFMDKDGNVCSSYAVNVLRWYPIDAGAGVLIQTVDAHKVLQYAADLLRALKWKGFANVAFMIDSKTNEPKLLEINGRIPASIKVAYMCGFNISRQMLEMIYDVPVIQYPENEKFGLYLRHFDTDVAWFIKSPNRFSSKPSWFSWKNTEEILWCKGDIKPFFVHFLQNIRGYRKKMKLKKH